MARKRHKKQSPQEKAKMDAMTDELINLMLTGQGLEPITDELIAELISKGKGDLETLRRFQAEGYQYSRARGSFFSPPEMGDS